MPEIPGARRSLWRATYTPVRTQQARGSVLAKGLSKRAFVASLRPIKSELPNIRRMLEPMTAARDLALSLCESVANETSARGLKRSTSIAAQASVEALTEVGRAIVSVRRQLMEHLKAAHEHIWAEYQKRIGLASPPTRPAVGHDWQPIAEMRGVPAVDRVLGRRMTQPMADASPREGTLPTGRHIRDVAADLTPVATEPGVREPGQFALGVLLDWAIANNVEPEVARSTRDLLAQWGVRAQDLTAVTFGTVADEQVDQLEELVDGFSESVAPEPVGFLHLERMNFVPAAIERGELLYSVPLAPGEEVHIAHKEWSQTSEEFSKIVTDSLENFSEEGVSEKSELAQSTTSENKRDTNINTAVTVSGSYGPVSVTASGDYSVSTSAAQTEESSRNQSITVTRKASTRSKREQKVSFKVASAAGTEDQQVRKIVNPFSDRATRVDYYRMLRKWRVNLFRYGVRMTYDLAIPEPASDVLSRIREIQDLQSILEQGFDSPSATLSWARFDLRPGDITRANYALLAAQYNASVDPPPSDVKWIDRAETKSWSKDEAKTPQFFALEIDTHDDYSVQQASEEHSAWAYPGNPWIMWVQDVADFVGKSGPLSLVYNTGNLAAFYLELHVQLRLRPEALDRWRMKAWSALRDAAQARYYEARQLFKERLERLTAELGGQDALSLRKFERDEIMKGVLRWLLGPTFQFNPVGIGPDLYATSGSIVSDATWSRVAGFGEMIKFLHQAIEWENVLYFLYPYFWSHRSRWDFKKYLDHPDPLHRAFLKAGSARVVLTVRPGFETAFAEFVENGGNIALPDDHPYVRIAEEIEDYARTNYPGIPSANPDEADQREQGVLIGTWFEYTPTSALDIAFDEATPSA